MRFYGNKNDGVHTGSNQRKVRTKTLRVTGSSERFSTDSVLTIVEHYSIVAIHASRDLGQYVGYLITYVYMTLNHSSICCIKLAKWNKSKAPE